MLNETQLIDTDGLFHNIVKQSATFDGRYTVLPNGPSDLNKGSVITGIELPDVKYPLVALLPPPSLIENLARELFSARLLFLTRTGHTEDSLMHDRDRNTNTSLRRIPQDWNDMKVLALAFFNTLYALQDHPSLRNQFLIDNRQEIRIIRFSEMQTDKFTGVLLTFVIGLGVQCAQTDINASAIQLPAGL